MFSIGVAFRGWSLIQLGSLFNSRRLRGIVLKKRKNLLAILYGFLWCVCKARNDSLFNKVRASPNVLADNVLSLVFNWIKLKHKGNYGNYNWAVWISSPFMIM